MGCLTFIFVLLAAVTFVLGFFLVPLGIPLWALTIILLLFAIAFKKR